MTPGMTRRRFLRRLEECLPVAATLTSRLGPTCFSSTPFTPRSGTPRSVQFTPRIIVNSARAAVASAVEGRGVARLFSYQVADYLRDGLQGLGYDTGLSSTAVIPVILQDELGAVLLHRQRRGEHARMGVRNGEDLQEPLDRTVLAGPPMQHIERDIRLGRLVARWIFRVRRGGIRE